MVAAVVDAPALAGLVHHVVCCKLCGENHEVAVLLFFHPLAEPKLRFIVLVVVRRVDEVAAGFFECIELEKTLVFWMIVGS